LLSTPLTIALSAAQVLGIDEPLVRRGTQNEYYLTDVLGSVVALSDANGRVTTGYNYSAYGKKASAGAATENRYGYTAQIGRAHV